jgi:modulator of FtsH protease
MEPWANFFLGELGASAALAGLLFVSLSVNQRRILELGRIAERGLEALIMLLLVLVVSSLALVPAQTPRLFAGEILLVAMMQLTVLTYLERVQWSTLEPQYRSITLRMFILSHVATWFVIAAAATLLWRGDWIGLYVLPAGMLLSFITSGMNAWVLLIEINR